MNVKKEKNVLGSLQHCSFERLCTQERILILTCSSTLSTVTNSCVNLIVATQLKVSFILFFRWIKSTFFLNTFIPFGFILLVVLFHFSYSGSTHTCI